MPNSKRNPALPPQVHVRGRKPQRWHHLPVRLLPHEAERVKRMGRARLGDFLRLLIQKLGEERVDYLRARRGIEHAEKTSGAPVLVCESCRRVTYLRHFNSSEDARTPGNYLGLTVCNRCCPDGPFAFRLRIKRRRADAPEAADEVWMYVPDDVYAACRAIGGGYPRRGVDELMTMHREIDKGVLFATLYNPVNLELPMEMPPPIPAWLE